MFYLITSDQEESKECPSFLVFKSTQAYLYRTFQAEAPHKVQNYEYKTNKKYSQIAVKSKGLDKTI